MNTFISAIVLTYNEEIHIARCLENLKQVASEIFVVDCFSTDQTCAIAESLGAHVVQHEYINQAQQFQWALDTLPCTGNWIMRMDADEYLSGGLIAEIREKLPTLSEEITGCQLLRDVVFLGRNLRHGRFQPPSILRLWRCGCVKMEQRWMDERCVLISGRTVVMKHRFVDHNLNSLTWWTQKHNNYSSRELMVEIGRRYGIFLDDNSEKLSERNLKKGNYYRLPPFFRAFVYFFMRYVLQGGFLDGRPGLIWAVLQAFWYRFLIDAKMYELENFFGGPPSRAELLRYFHERLGIKIDFK